MRRALVLWALIAAIIAVAPRSVSAAVPATVVARIEAAAQVGRVDRSAALVGDLDNAHLATSVQRQNRRRRDAALGAVVVEAIATHPGLAGEIAAAAVAAAPDARDVIVTAASRAFPGFAPAIDAAVGAVQPGAAPPPTSTAQLIYPAPIRPSTPAASATLSTSEGNDQGDPWEGFNRVIFSFNDTLDIYLIRPIAVAYGTVVPDAAKAAARRFFANLKSPVILANDLLQVEGRDAAVTTGRFLVNTTIGMVGLFDPASDFGLDGHPADFGQTLHVYGVGGGPYVMLPALGPSTVRDAVGRGVDAFFNPWSYFLAPYESIAVTAAKGITKRETLIEPIDDLRQNSIDFYAAVRSLYNQDRAVELNRGREPDSANIDVLFDSFE